MTTAWVTTAPRGQPGAPVASWRRASQDQRIDAVPGPLRKRLAATAERIAVTFAFAAHSRAEADHLRSRAAWNQLVADFELRQAAALRSGRLLATPWRVVASTTGHRRRPTA